MEKVQIFPTEIFIFENPNIDNEALIAKTKTLDNVEIKKTTTLSMLYNLGREPEFKELYDWFAECLEEIRVKQKYDCEKIEITNSWFNVALGGYQMFQNYHKHSMSMFSGVYYLSEGAATSFEDPEVHRSEAELEVLRFDYQPWYHSDAKPGKLVIFPSWLYHRTDPHFGSNDRYVISFNSFPTGRINHNLATDSKITIQVKHD